MDDPNGFHIVGLARFHDLVVHVHDVADLVSARRNGLVELLEVDRRSAGEDGLRCQAGIATKVLATALDTQTAAAGSLIEALSVSVPAGLTFSSDGGLSAGHQSRFIADL